LFRICAQNPGAARNPLPDQNREFSLPQQGIFSDGTGAKAAMRFELPNRTDGIESI
jgi:hypothetical protein